MDSIIEETRSPYPPRKSSRRTSRTPIIPRKPVGNQWPTGSAGSISVVPPAVTHPRRHGSLNDDGVSPVSRLSTEFRSPIDRTVSSIFSPETSYLHESMHENSPPTKDAATNPLPFMDLNAHEQEMRQELDNMIDEVVSEYSRSRSSQRPESNLRPESEIRSYREPSMYSQNEAAQDAPIFMEMSAEEAAMRNSRITSVGGVSLAGTLTRSEQQNIEWLDQRASDGDADPWRLQSIQRGMPQPGLEPSTGRRGPINGCNWLPIALRWWYMTFLFLFALGFGLAAIILTLRSEHNQGLGLDQGTSAFLFTWRFVPTLMAVIYTILVMAVINDIKRTEPFARLSRPGGASAEVTLFLKSGSMWTDPVNTLWKRKNGGFRNWALFWASIVNILAILIVAPFSAGFVSPQEVQVQSYANFSQVMTSLNGSLELSTDDSVFFRTISSVLLDTTTSAWLSKEFAVLPFWPSNQNTVPFGASLANSAQTWQANTTVYQTDLECMPMSLQSVSSFTLDQSLLFPPNQTVFSDVNLTSFVLESADGCSLGLAGLPSDFSGMSFFSNGGGWWAGAPNFSYPLLWSSGNGSATDFNFDNPILLNTSSQCSNRTMFFFATPLLQNQTLQAEGQICTSTYFSANIPVTVTNNGSSSDVSFDAVEFENTKSPITPTTLDIPAFENAFLSQNWSSKFQSPDSSSNPDLPVRPRLGGPLNLLGAQNNFDVAAMLSNTNLTGQALQIKQAFFGVSLQKAFSQIGTQQAQVIRGTTAVSERRIVVSLVVGIILTVSLLWSALMILLIMFHTRRRIRPLNVSQDPASTTVMASLISSKPNIQKFFKGVDRYPEEAMYHNFADHVFYLRNGELYAYDMKDIFTQPVGSLSEPAYAQLAADDWCPKVIRGRFLAFLMVLLVATMITLAALFGVFRYKGIYQQILFSKLNVDFENKSVTALAPYSIIPTLIALSIKLWWASIDETFRRLQPFVTMAEKATPNSRGATSSYANTPLIWTAVKAAMNREFLLTVVAIGAVLTQIFTVSISGLWDRNTTFRPSNVTVAINVEFRTVPTIFTVPVPLPLTDVEHNLSAGVLTNVFDNQLANWLYSSVDQGVYNVTAPAWTSQDWAFAPLDLTSVQAPRETEAEKEASASLGSANNVTVQTTSLRGRLECTSLDMSNTSAWLNTLDFSDRSKWNNDPNIPANLTTGYELKLGLSMNETMEGGFEYWSDINPYFSFFAANNRLTCCGNNANSTDETAVGYWSPAADSLHTSIVVKWITGHPFPFQFNDSTPLSNRTPGDGYGSGFHWVWKDIPKVTAMNCSPVFETSNASVTVDLDTGAVQEYTILNTPVEDPNAFMYQYQGLNVSLGVPYSNIPGVGAGFQVEQGFLLQNVSVSYGYLFHDILLGAANARRTNIPPQVPPLLSENLNDRTFNFRLPGLNTDFMSYTSLSLASSNKSALLDSATLADISSTVFSTFFKNYITADIVSNDALYANGTWGLQPRGAVPAADLGGYQIENLTIFLQNTSLPSSTNATSSATLTTMIEKLDLSTPAVIICLTILCFLILATIAIMFLHRKYLSLLPRDVNTLGSVLGFVYGSERLLRLASDSEGLRGKGSMGQMSKMGWFEAGGKRRWGVEIVKPGDRFLSEFIGTGRGFQEVRLGEGDGPGAPPGASREMRDVNRGVSNRPLR